MQGLSTPASDDVTFGASDMLLAPSDIFDAEKIFEISKDACAAHKAAREKRKAVSAILVDANNAARDLLKSKVTEHPFKARAATTSYTYLTDQIVKTSYRIATEVLHPISNPTKAQQLCVLAVGGYGRAQMAPFSDVDLLFLLPYKLSDWSESVIESMLYILWDTKLKIGHSTRSIDECVTQGTMDQTIKTSLLESRYLIGPRDLAEALDKRLWNKLFKGSDAAYIEEKLTERELRHKRHGGLRYLQEPNIKEGKGGLRDLQTLFWITKHLAQTHSQNDMISLGHFTHEEMAKFNRAHDFLWAVRNQLHLLANRASEQLTFDAQVEISKIMGFEDKDGQLGVEAFMQQYFIHATLVGELTRVFLTKLEADHVKDQPSLSQRLLSVMSWRNANSDDGTPDGYKLDNGRLNIADETQFFKDPLNILRLFREALVTELLIHPEAMRQITAHLHLFDEDVRANPEAAKIFLSALLDFGNPERALRRMNELGVLGAFIPEFQRIVAMMQFNIYHHYTVDEHTIQCISGLAEIETGEMVSDFPVVSKILKAGLDRKILYVALLLHDIGKGLPEDHSIAGARIAADVCPRLGLSETETETVIWLVEYHLLMSDVAQKRDLSDPRTVLNFARQVITRRRLDLLTVLTVCDIRGVGPGTWNNWKAQLLRELYHASKSSINAGLDKIGVYNRVDEAKSELKEALTDWSEEAIEDELERHYDPYWQGLDLQSHKTFAKLLSKMKDDTIASDMEPDKDRDATRLCMVMQDHHGLFSRIVGALAVVGANIVDARTYTTSDGYATAIFWMQDKDGKPYEKSKLKRMTKAINETLQGLVMPKTTLIDKDKFKKREREFIVPTEIIFDNEGSERYSIIEVDTRDRPGLLFDLTMTLKNANINIASAVIATYGAQAVDVFYVKDMFGTKIHSKRKQQIIADRLREAIDSATEEAMS